MALEAIDIRGKSDRLIGQLFSDGCGIGGRSDNLSDDRGVNVWAFKCRDRIFDR